MKLYLAVDSNREANDGSIFMPWNSKAYSEDQWKLYVANWRKYQSEQIAKKIKAFTAEIEHFTKSPVVPIEGKIEWLFPTDAERVLWTGFNTSWPGGSDSTHYYCVPKRSYRSPESARKALVSGLNDNLGKAMMALSKVAESEPEYITVETVD